MKLVDAPTPVGPRRAMAWPAVDCSVAPITPFAMSFERIVRFLMSALRTELFLICLLPILVTAYDVPPSATKSAQRAITFENVAYERNMVSTLWFLLGRRAARTGHVR